jgi:hypothetical protein
MGAEVTVHNLGTGARAELAESENPNRLGVVTLPVSHTESAEEIKKAA